MDGRMDGRTDGLLVHANYILLPKTIMNRNYVRLHLATKLLLKPSASFIKYDSKSQSEVEGQHMSPL